MSQIEVLNQYPSKIRREHCVLIVIWSKQLLLSFII